MTDSYLKVPTTPKCKHGIYVTGFCDDCYREKEAAGFKPIKTHDELGNQLVDKALSEYERITKIARDAHKEAVNPYITKAVGMLGRGTGFKIPQEGPPFVRTSYCLEIAMPPQVSWRWRLWRVLCLPYDLYVFIKTGRLRFL